jgi:hypothetical protein
MDISCLLIQLVRPGRKLDRGFSVCYTIISLRLVLSTTTRRCEQSPQSSIYIPFPIFITKSVGDLLDRSGAAQMAYVSAIDHFDEVTPEGTLFE